MGINIEPAVKKSIKDLSPSSSNNISRKLFLATAAAVSLLFGSAIAGCPDEEESCTVICTEPRATHDGGTINDASCITPVDGDFYVPNLSEDTPIIKETLDCQNPKIAQYKRNGWSCEYQYK